MAELPGLLMCHVLPGRLKAGEAPSQSQTLLRERAEWLPLLGASVGCEVTSIDAKELGWQQVGEASFQDALEQAKALWWVGQVAYLDEMESLYMQLQQHIGRLPTPPQIYEHPDAVEESFHLEQQFYRLDGRLGEGLHQPQTAFCSLGFDPTEYGVDEMAERLQQRLEESLSDRWEELSQVQGRAFFRTYYGTQKLSAYLNAARSFDDLVEGCVSMVEALRYHQPIRGIAVRQWLPIRQVVDDLLGDKFRCEYRVFVVDGEVAGWVWEPGRLLGETDNIKKRVEAGRLDELAPDDALQAIFAQCATHVGRGLRSRFVAADVAVLDDGSHALIEVNPGHCAGWGQKATAAAVYGRWMETMLDLPHQPPEAHCEALGCEPWGLGVVCGW